MIVPAGPAAAEETVSVTLVQGYSPASLTVRTGEAVVWRNDDKADFEAYPVGRHKVRADDGSFESEVLPPGASFVMTFLSPGTFAYRCALHPSLMTGEVIATGPAITPTPKEQSVSIVERSSSDFAFDPQDIVIPVGTTVTWRNNGTVVHTATADGVFDSGDLEPGQKFSFTFSNPLSIRYVCTPHKEFMTGTVRVVAAGGEVPPPPPPRSRPAAGSVRAPVQETRQGTEPVTFNVLAVEPDPATPATWGYAPAALQARVGDTVVWRNAGVAPHTVTAVDRSFDSGNMATGDIFSRRLTKTGAIAYLCTLHPWMKGSITVAAAGSVLKGAPPGTPQGADPSGIPGAEASSENELLDPHAKARTRLGLALIALSAVVCVGLSVAASRGHVLTKPALQEPPGEAEFVVDLGLSDALPDEPELTDSADERERELVLR